MKAYIEIRRLFIFLLIGIFLISCSQNELTGETINYQDDKTNVSLTLAKKVALNFSKDDAFIRDSIKQNLNIKLRSNKHTKNSFPDLKEKEIDEVITFKNQLGTTALFVVKFLPNGYIIVPSTTKEAPILAFSNDGIFDQSNIPHGLLYWIQMRTEIITELENDDTYNIPEEITNQWIAVAPPDDDDEIISGGSVHEGVGPIISTRWARI